MEWINAKERLPQLDKDSDYDSETFIVAVRTGLGLETTAMVYRKLYVYKKLVERWEWNGRISQWEVEYWMPLPEPPSE